ncbi:MAG: hypothetical protein HS104_29050 [Polyangiaceae bacterium]|nr:hypothetical protein [Polyangiaceae bacterium]MCE7895115.1 hypothetical protein [Sorangiineae bacterium PRO1]MCL4755966.1 hypothetical protein [Myxococcales bacterium]
MSNKRKLRRAQAPAQTVTTRAVPSRDALRKQTAAERFAKAGSEKLWLALLGWEPERQARIWLAQAIHDGARQRAPTGVAEALKAHSPDAAAKLEPSAIESGVDVWLASGDAYDPSDPAPKWHYLTNLADKLGLGATTPEAYQDDWEAWCSLFLASGPRATLMAALAQTEQAAIALQSTTRSARIGGLVNLSRAMWSAVAYGDDASFDHLERAGTDWLANIAGKIRPS